MDINTFIISCLLITIFCGLIAVFLDFREEIKKK